MSDFTVQNEGTIVLLRADSDHAKDWAADHLPPDAPTFGPAVIVEHRYIDDILTGIINDGLTVYVR